MGHVLLQQQRQHKTAGETANFTRRTATNGLFAEHKNDGISLITGFVVITHGVKGKGDIHIC